MVLYSETVEFGLARILKTCYLLQRNFSLLITPYPSFFFISLVGIRQPGRIIV